MRSVDCKSKAGSRPALQRVAQRQGLAEQGLCSQAASREGRADDCKWSHTDDGHILTSRYMEARAQILDHFHRAFSRDTYSHWSHTAGVVPQLPAVPAGIISATSQRCPSHVEASVTGTIRPGQPSHITCPSALTRHHSLAFAAPRCANAGVLICPGLGVARTSTGSGRCRPHVAHFQPPVDCFMLARARQVALRF